MIKSRDYWRVMNGGYLDNPHFSFCPLFRLGRIRGKRESADFTTTKTTDYGQRTSEKEESNEDLSAAQSL